jgi:hypothetical protein
MYADHTCGLSAWATSIHSAWWEAVIGGSPSVHGRDERTTYSDEARTADCPRPPPDPQTPTGAAGGGYGQGGYCVVSIWYDLYTGEVLDVDVLWCEKYGS